MPTLLRFFPDYEKVLHMCRSAISNVKLNCSAYNTVIFLYSIVEFHRFETMYSILFVICIKCQSLH